MCELEIQNEEGLLQEETPPADPTTSLLLLLLLVNNIISSIGAQFDPPTCDSIGALRTRVLSRIVLFV